MQTNKERLIAALQEPLESTFANYKTSALGLVDDQVEEKPRCLWRKCHHKKVKKIP